MADIKKFALDDDALDTVAGGCWSEEGVMPIVGGYRPRNGERVRAYCPSCGGNSDWCYVLDCDPDPDIHPGEVIVECGRDHNVFYTNAVYPAPPQTTGDPFL